MPFKWVNCQYCNHNKHINAYPLAMRKHAAKHGTAICTACCEKHDEHYLAPIERHGEPFFKFMLAIGAKP